MADIGFARRWIAMAALCLFTAAAASAQDERSAGRQGKAKMQASDRRAPRGAAPRSTDGPGDALAAHWTFDGDCQDRSGNGNHGRPHAVDMTAAGRSGQPGTAARFNGVDSCIEVADSKSLAFGNEDFTIAAWVQLPEDTAGPVGDILSKYDSERRCGVNLCVKASSAGASSYGDARNVVFGIDNGMEAPWEDCGRPWPGNTYLETLTVYKGALYVGIADAPRREDACHVFRYAGGQKWEDCGRVAKSLNTPSAYSMTVHKGDLYCGTGTVDWVAIKPGQSDFARVYRYGGGKKWIDCGAPRDTYRIQALASFGGDLYAQTDDVTHPAGKPHLYRYLGGTEWEGCGAVSNSDLSLSLMAHNGRLYSGMGGPGEILRYEGGTQWTYVGTPHGNDQWCTMGLYRGQLYAGAWAEGLVCRYEGGMDWTRCGVLGLQNGLRKESEGAINEIQDLTVHNGKMYASTIPKAEVYRYEGGTEWTLMRRLVSNPDYDPRQIDSWARATSLTEFGGRLYAGTGTCRGGALDSPHYEFGRVYSFMAGQCVSYDDDLGAGWHHIAAVRQGGNLKLYIDGKLASSSRPFPPGPYTLSNNEPLYIGFGALDYFSGAMDEARIYRRALGEKEIAILYREK